MNYRIIDAFSPLELSEQVQKHLDDDWALYGNPIMTVWNDRVIFCQAITKEEKVSDDQNLK